MLLYYLHCCIYILSILNCKSIINTTMNLYTPQTRGPAYRFNQSNHTIDCPVNHTTLSTNYSSYLKHSTNKITMTNKQDKAQTLLHMQHTLPKPGAAGDTAETWTYSLVPHERVSTILSIQVRAQVTHFCGEMHKWVTAD